MTEITETYAMGQPHERLKVYYNSACPVCEFGIGQQKEKLCEQPIDWVDIHTDIAARTDIDASLEYVRKRLHVIDVYGDVKIGIDAFIELWQQSPNERWLARLFRLPVIHGLAAAAYNGFAWLLYLYNRLCRHW